jgi:multiple sugar transport system ATP-binding protein
MAGIEVTSLHKRFPDGTVAVERVDLTIGDGELFVMLGPSGCGKTTTLRAMAGLERQTSGDIRIGSTLVNDLPPAERDIAMVFQFYALYPHLKTRDNLAFPLRAEGLPEPEVRERVDEAARMMRLGPLLDRRPQRLSGGEQQRVALARALVRRPRAFLMDEPLTNLDAELRADMRTEIKHLQTQLGTTMVYVTHDQVEAMSLGHRIAILNQGRVEQIGTPLEVYDRPASLFCATFIGSPPMNLVPRGEVLIGFRPEHLLPKENVTGDRITVALDVQRMEYLSGDRHVYGTIQLGNHPTRVIARLPATVDTPIAVGEQHDFAIAAHRLRFFDERSGQRTEPLRVGA